MISTDFGRWAVTALVSVLGAASVAGCAGSGPEGPTASSSTSAAADRQYALTVLSNRPATSRIQTYTSLAEAMPNHAYKKGNRTLTASDVVVVGRVVGVQKGRGFTVPTEDAETGVETDFDDKEADWKTFHLEIEVRDQLAGTPVGDRVLAGMGIVDMRTDFDRMADGLLALGDVVVPLQSGSTRFAYDPEVRAVAGGGELLAVLDARGTLDLPLAGGHGKLRASQGSLDQLKQAIAKPTVTAVPSRME